MIGFRIACHQGHECMWHSQPYQHDIPLGNLLIAAALLITGCTFAKISAFAAALNLQLFSKTCVQQDSAPELAASHPGDLG